MGSPWLLAEPEQMSWGGARSITTLLWPARVAVCHQLAAPPQNISQRWHNPQWNRSEMFCTALWEVWRQGEAGRELHAWSCPTTLQPLPPFTSTTTPRSRSYHPHLADDKSEAELPFIWSPAAAKSQAGMVLRQEWFPSPGSSITPYTSQHDVSDFFNVTLSSSH